MGVSASSVQVIEPVRLPLPQKPLVDSAVWMRYSLSFTFRIQATESGAPTASDIESALMRCQDRSVWYSYIECLMSDAASDPDDEPVYMRVGKVNVKLRSTKNPSKWRGRVTWISKWLPEDAVWSAVEWRIGDRMSCYEIQDDGGTWFTSIEPTALALRVPKKKSS